MRRVRWKAFVLALALTGGCVLGSVRPRPFIWVESRDRAAVLEKIGSTPWALAAFDAMRERVEAGLARHRADPDAFLRELPFTSLPTDEGDVPAFEPIIRAFTGEQPARSVPIQHRASFAIDCGVLYFLSGDEAYARCAADVLTLLVDGLGRLQPVPGESMGGLLFPRDFLYEARVLGAQVPIIYDFVEPYLRGGGTVHRLRDGVRGVFPFDQAQALFRTYARLAIDRGPVGNNHPVLEMPCLAHNALALDDEDERAAFLAYLVSKDTPHQDSLATVMDVHVRSGAVWPEPFGYSAAVSSYVTYLVTLLKRYDPVLISTERCHHIALAPSRLAEMKFPNGEYIRFGDGPRRARDGYWAFEIAYALGRSSGDAALQSAFGGLINRGIESDRYDRAANRGYDVGSSPYFEPIRLLWFAPEIDAGTEAFAVRTTDVLPYAGLVLQRNLSEDGDPAHALMAVVSGAHFTHAHASGMALDLFGVGEVLGTNAGPGTYQTDEHENYRRLFAAHNSVIVNGSSRSDGGWVNLAINTVETIAVEPAVGAAPVSPSHSFSLSRFDDDKGDAAEAVQERLVGIVRTSPTSGFYVDVFRSKSSLPGQFHDYLYHNIGDSLAIRVGEGELPRVASPDRFLPVAGTEWRQNRSYLFPGWHVFRDVQTSERIESDVVADFAANELRGKGAHMRLFVPGAARRDYSTAWAPPTKEAPGRFAQQLTPVLIVRTHGEAWTRPFAVVFEPFAGSAGTVESVAGLAATDRFDGFRVTSRHDGVRRTHLILVQSGPASVWEDRNLGIELCGRYAVITLDEREACVSLYLGEGLSIRYKGIGLRSRSRGAVAAFVEFSEEPPKITSTGPVDLFGLDLSGGGRHSGDPALISP